MQSVIGASMGGLMAARALAEHYGTVTIVERDELPASPQPRKGVPQGKHAHGLLAKGREVLEQLFPGFTQEMTMLGTPSGDIVKDCMWFNHGFYLCKTPSALIGIGHSSKTPFAAGWERYPTFACENPATRWNWCLIRPKAG